MKLKDRLNKSKIVNNISMETHRNNKNGFLISDIFTDSDEVRNYIVNLAESKRNIILVSNKSFDKMIIADYIKSQLRKTNVRIIDDIDVKTDDLNGRINILPNPDIHIIVKVMEQIIYGCQSFIFGINLGTYDNVINKLKVLIALNHKNLTPIDIVTLIGAMDAVIIYVSKNEDGLFFISRIDEIKMNKTQSELELNIIWGKDVITDNNDNNENKEEITEIEEEENTNTIENIEDNTIETNTEKNSAIEQEIVLQEETKEKLYTEENENNLYSEEKDEIINTNEKEETESISDEKMQRLNKYQILKERARKKRLEAKENINQKV